MWANKIIHGIIAPLVVIVLPIEIVTTFVLGILVAMTFGLLLAPFSIIWVVLFFAPLLGLSWLWGKAPLLRIPLAIVGIPLAVLGYIYTSLIPSMGENESKATKLRLCLMWPFTWEYWAFVAGKIPFGSEEHRNLDEVLHKLAGKDATIG